MSPRFEKSMGNSIFGSPYICFQLVCAAFEDKSNTFVFLSSIPFTKNNELGSNSNIIFKSLFFYLLGQVKIYDAVINSGFCAFMFFSR